MDATAREPRRGAVGLGFGRSARPAGGAALPPRVRRSPPPSRPPGATGPRLLWFNPHGTLGILPLGPKPLTLGRGKKADLPLPAPEASRSHCQVGLDPATGEAWVEDLRSVAGTRVDGTPITTRTALIDGDLLELPGTRVGYLAE